MASQGFGDLLPIISYFMASQGKRAVKVPTYRMLHETLCHAAAGISIVGLDDGVIFTLFLVL